MNQLKERRQSMGLSQIKLGELSGVPYTWISDFERGTRLPWPKARRKLATALGCPEEELFKPKK